MNAPRTKHNASSTDFRSTNSQCTKHQARRTKHRLMNAPSTFSYSAHQARRTKHGLMNAPSTRHHISLALPLPPAFNVDTMKAGDRSRIFQSRAALLGCRMRCQYRRPCGRRSAWHSLQPAVRTSPPHVPVHANPSIWDQISSIHNPPGNAGMAHPLSTPTLVSRLLPPRNTTSGAGWPA